ncbi:endonuclease/exonuclease/phosphatase family protein [Streptomyces beijiangensis]|uniref:Endonuclease/exonuclease/phosphatase family protein n=1 Tax=Streptomyces beijiangensis TaxID=163361 RepID=A0A939JEX8_9ACTN|nr:endonuclease/exonuclease/phosphatase family protein [Streptomyces beijiangensis]MBO0513541.1 endonuclease/exonuclease/phosphatase family protein [Streptomyces beijiangensis]
MRRHTGLNMLRPRNWTRRTAIPLMCVVVVAVALLSIHHPTQKITGRQLRIATWNMCDIKPWGCPNTGSNLQKVMELKRLATVDGAQVILVQETCSSDLERARKGLGHGWSSVLRPYVNADKNGKRSTMACTVGNRGTAGFGILASTALSRVSEVSSPEPTVGMQRGIICASVAAQNLRVCNAHLTLPGSDLAHPHREYRADELKILVKAAAGDRTVFGGDFNSTPPDPGDPGSWIWPQETYSRYRECDQKDKNSRSGRTTHKTGHKLDYLFTALPRTGCTVRNTGASDHRALIMQIKISD